MPVDTHSTAEERILIRLRTSSASRTPVHGPSRVPCRVQHRTRPWFTAASIR
jgi:hypothetical protein